jgi:hypothetical protein
MRRCSIPAAFSASNHSRERKLLMPVVCGPSNVGYYFAAHGIDATCGFGVTHENLHAPNERIKLNTIQMTSDVYATAIYSLPSWPIRWLVESTASSVGWIKPMWKVPG